ncbi:Alpha/Beta hydrolase protein [Kockovaella imperatae]|uniref:Alpha/Beta hydrolase protein n=1 Tax=Kockovaella imperatae TaxID=4999 RepID=A0A1Y1UJ36_9TREE|nr:Alpha/Beta hydrolase protein [Kockovaella imperatae]ORX38070.1 Alpha/Beta hydrolase protein [Kockovaella imperatae]
MSATETVSGSAATAGAVSTSLPGSRSASPAYDSHRLSTPPPPPPSKPIPQDFRSSLSAWWYNSSYKEARYAEERLLRRMSMFEPSAPPPQAKGWFGLGGSGRPDAQHLDSSAQVVDESLTRVETQVGSHGLIAKLRDVFIPTPDPSVAPQHPVDPVPAASSSASSIASGSDKCRKHHSKHAQTPGKYKDYINTLEISSKENQNSKEAVVVLHGYAAAMGFFFRNWDSIAQSANSTGRPAYFLDWLGMGLSSRPEPHLLSSPANAPVPARVARAEHFFLSSLESWRERVGLDKMVLVGHSLGGYLASAYAVRYPDRVSGLILVSPAGVPHGEGYKYYKPSGEKNAGDLDDAVDAAQMEMEVNSEPKGEAKQWRENREKASFARKSMMKFFVWGWEKGMSPFSVLRAIGPWGPMFAANYTTRRFASLSDDDKRDLHSYVYNTSVLKGSGEYCISHILAPGAYARIPIVDRINRVKVPVTFIYGDNDWMDVDGGKASVEALTKAGNKNGSVHVVEKAGHHVYLDNAEETNRIIREAIASLPKP